MENTEFSINKRENEYPYYKLNLNVECNNYDVKYRNDGTAEKENRIHMNDENIIKKRVAREVLSMIETVCFGEEFREYRINKGSNGTRDLIIENIKKTYEVG